MIELLQRCTWGHTETAKTGIIHIPWPQWGWQPPTCATTGDTALPCPGLGWGLQDTLGCLGRSCSPWITTSSSSPTSPGGKFWCWVGGVHRKIAKCRDLSVSGLSEGQDWICWSEEGLDLENPWWFIPSHPCLCPAWSSLEVSPGQDVSCQRSQCALQTSAKPYHRARREELNPFNWWLWARTEIKSFSQRHDGAARWSKGEHEIIAGPRPLLSWELLLFSVSTSSYHHRMI